ncbi:hypothetical protein EJD97_017130 [Solanum chilense]|uniref:Uncharacterized protein n=1 Tax=Solanum chilense TaxID=4083 RepID=A0A6N2B8D3_SOLCI|nr:hypothetical protein EJD97_017130 [Solanum chilense]
MNTRRNTERRLEEEESNVGVPPRGDQVPPLEEDVNDDQSLVIPLHLTDENIKASLFQMSQTITTQAEAATTQAQDMTTHANREIVPRSHQQVATMASHLRKFTSMNLHTLYGVL